LDLGQVNDYLGCGSCGFPHSLERKPRIVRQLACNHFLLDPCAICHSHSILYYISGRWRPKAKETKELYDTNQRNAQFFNLIFYFEFLLSLTCFEPLGVHPQKDSCICIMVCFTCTDACKTHHNAYTTVSLRMNPNRFEACKR